MPAMKYNVTYSPDAPGGYAGKHEFHTMRARTSFIERAEKRGTGKEWIVDRKPQ